MGGEFTITVDGSRNLLRVSMQGFFTVEDVHRYRAAIDAATRQLSAPPAAQAMINDISAMSIQSQEIVAAFQRVMADARYVERRVAFVIASTLARMQLSRIIGSRTARMVASVAEAEAWLFGDAAAAAA